MPILKMMGSALGEEPAELEDPNVKKQHRHKTHALWKCFDLTVDKPSCKLSASSGSICGMVPSPSAGTSNYWSHLWDHHRMQWYELKRADGKLNAAGEAELSELRKMLEKAGTSFGQDHNKGGGHLKAVLSGSAKETADAARQIFFSLQAIPVDPSHPLIRILLALTEAAELSKWLSQLPRLIVLNICITRVHCSQ
ncbi:hypothetical protein AB1Y20_023646 [Prymnesium parvum]|uniref:Uncharacterized protein n=1 Tax=Prymnesium parvum TaxID=97485 RepID=A0AB34JEF9_PRYPA